MEHIETIQEFYESVPEGKQLFLPIENSGVGHFNVFRRWRCMGTYQRSDFYKIVLVIGTGILHYADKRIVIDHPALFLTNPSVPYSWEPVSEKQEGWFCLFTDAFIQSDSKKVTQQTFPVFHSDKTPVSFLDEDALNNTLFLFQKMGQEMESDYIYKYSVLRNYLHLLVHEAQKLHPETGLKGQQTDAAHRITFQFLELLEQQFPTDSPDTPLILRTPQDYANNLSVHINHLNHSVKKVTNKTSSQIIANRIVQEATALLQNSNWNIAEIAYALGFEYPSHFTNFFRKNTGTSPKELR